MRRSLDPNVELAPGLLALAAELERRQLSYAEAIRLGQEWEYARGGETLRWSLSYFSRWFQGKRGVSHQYARVFNGLFGIPIEHFVDRRTLGRSLQRRTGARPDASLEAMVKRDFLSMDLDEAIAALQDLTAADIASRRDVLVAMAVVTGAVLVGPIRQWAGAILPTMDEFRPGNLGMDEVDDLEEMLRVFYSWGAQTGVRRRKAVIGQLREMGELLEGSHPPAVRQRLLEIAAQMAQSAGWMSYDSRMYGVAQRYQLLSLHLCREAGNRLIAAKVMGDMAQVASVMGNHQEALDLLASALYSLPSRREGFVQAELLGLQASTQAILGDGSDARRSIEAALEAGAKGGPEALPIFSYLNPAEIRCLATRTYLDLGTDFAGLAEEHATTALAARGDHFVRSRALDTLRLMSIRLLQGEPIEAIALGNSVLDFAGEVRAARLTDRLIDFHNQLPPLPQTSEFRDRLRPYMARWGEPEARLVA